MGAEATIKAKNITLPTPNAPMANYVTSVRAGNLPGCRMAAVGILRLRFFLRHRSAAGLMRRMTVAVILDPGLATAAGGVLHLRR